MDPIQQNIKGVQELVSSKVNKITYGSETSEGVKGEKEDVLTLDMSDDELLKLAKEWTNKYRGYEAKIKPRQEANKEFYLGKQNGTGEGISANLIFEAEETFLPAALSKNPEAVVWGDNTPEGTELANSVKTMLQYHSDVLVLRRKLTLMTRHWSIFFIGIIKHGWDSDIKDIKLEVRKPQNFVFDVDGYVDSYGDFEGYLGERIEISAGKLKQLFPKAKEYIGIQTQGKDATKVIYTEWWNDDYCFYTFREKILDKHKNPHFRYGSEEAQGIDDNGENIMVPKEERNHFSKPKKPYTFLSVFSLGEQPHDITGLIEQNISNQRRITRRTEQLDYNLSRANNSDVFSGTNFNQETAKQAAGALAKGNPILVPAGGPISEAIHRLNAPSVGAEFFRELEVSKQDLRTIFGTQGITAQPQNEDQTARGLILNQSHDTTRIGGGIGDAIEQVADNIFNWWVQLYHVYYDEPHFASIIGQTKAVEYVTLSSDQLDRQLVISVSPDSMKPKDEITVQNQAVALWQAGALDPKTLLTMLNIPDPQTTAESTVLWLLDKSAYMQMNFPELTQKLAQMQQQAMVTQGGIPGQAGGQPPEAITEPEPETGLSMNAASADLSNVPIT